MTRRSLGLTLVCGLLVPGSAAAGALVRVSGRSPFAECAADRVSAQPGRNFLHSEVEPQIAVNPRNPNNVVALYQQDRWSNGGARGLVASVSFDGGDTWEQVVVPGLSTCSGGAYGRATDPWLSFSPTGELHLIALALDVVSRVRAPGGYGPNALLVSRSSDGGFSWTPPIAIVADEDGLLHDKESISADPTDPSGRLVYAVWDRFSQAGAPALFSRSTDGGRTWEPARVIHDPGPTGHTVGHQIVVHPDGTLLDCSAKSSRRRR